MIAYDGASIRLGFKSGDMGGVDGGYGHRLRPEANQVVKEIGLEDKGYLEAKRAPEFRGPSLFWMGL